MPTSSGDASSVDGGIAVTLFIFHFFFFAYKVEFLFSFFITARGLFWLRWQKGTWRVLGKQLITYLDKLSLR